MELVLIWACVLVVLVFPTYVIGRRIEQARRVAAWFTMAAEGFQGISKTYEGFYANYYGRIMTTFGMGMLLGGAIGGTGLGVTKFPGWISVCVAGLIGGIVAYVKHGDKLKAE